MRKSLNTFAAMLIILSLSGAAIAAEPAGESTSKAGVVNINTAEAAQLALLPRVGPKAAERIIEYRKANGGFRKATDLMQVKGIGDKTFELLSPYIAVEGKTTLTTKQNAPKKARSRTASSDSNASPTAH